MTEHNTTIDFDEDKDAYVRDCTCPDTKPREHHTYDSAFRAGFSHWQKEVKK